MTETKLSAIYNYRAVDDRLATSGQPTEAQLHDIAVAGYAVIINLALHDDPRYSLSDEAGLVHSLGMAYRHIPVIFSDPTERDLLAFFAAMETHQHQKIWLHCAANMRASCFLGLYRVIRQAWQTDPAFTLMDGIWQADEVWSAFIRAILEKHTRQTNSKT